MTDEEFMRMFRKGLLQYTKLLIEYIDRMNEKDDAKSVLRKLRYKLQSQLDEV